MSRPASAFARDPATARYYGWLVHLLAPVLVGLALMYPPVVVGNTQPSRCQDGPRDKTLAVNAEARIFSHPSVFTASTSLGAPRLYACLYRTGRARVLADGYAIAWFASPAVSLVGFKVAFAASVQLANGGDAYLAAIVDDLRKPRGLQNQYYVDPPSFEIGKVRVKANGAVAWIGCNAEEVPGQLTRASERPGLALDTVVKHDSGSPNTDLVTLDQSHGIDPRSLSLRDSTLSWVDDGQRHTAQLH